MKHFSADRWLYLFICLHLLAWTLGPALVRYNLPLDAIEGTVWGHQLAWGYDKNPFLNAWLTALATYLDGHTGLLVYLFSQLSVVACFWAVWKLARAMLTPAYALISVMLLEGIQYYNLHAIDFNDNTLELSLWALTSYFFYCALQKKTAITRSWVLTGIFAGLGMMAKYYTAALLAGMALLLLLDPDHRKQLVTLPPYLGLFAFLALILPHALWLFSHDFVTVTYVFERASSPPNWTNHLFFPAQFASQQLQAFLPALVLLSVLLIGKLPAFAPHQTMRLKDRNFLVYVGLGPFLLTLLLSITLGIKLRAGWGMPLMSLWGIIMVAWLQPAISLPKIRRFIACTLAFMGLLVSGYSVALINTTDASSANFPGRELAKAITQAWHAKYSNRLAYVAGSRWIGGNVAFYSSDHPAVFMEWNKRRAFWIDEADLRKQGGVFVWDVSGDEVLPKEIAERYPSLRPSKVMTFAWHRNKRKEPLRIGVALLPPG